MGTGLGKNAFLVVERAQRPRTNQLSYNHRRNDWIAKAAYLGCVLRVEDSCRPTLSTGAAVMGPGEWVPNRSRSCSRDTTAGVRHSLPGGERKVGARCS